MVGRGSEIAGTLYVDYSNESVKQAKFDTHSARGERVEIQWRKIP